jgi:spore protease
MESRIRTDLALEARELWQEQMGETTKLQGVKASHQERDGFVLDVVEILDEEGEKALGKPVGSYVTLELDALVRREENAFARAAGVLADELRRTLSLQPDESVLVAGLGNPDITPDAVGPGTVDYVMVTRHLKESMPKDFEAFRSVSAFRSGVLGTTGLESARLISAVTELSSPARIIAVDALAARKMDRLCRTIQLSNTGIVPGSGVGNRREALNRETLGVPVIAVGVPTVVDAATLAMDLAEQAGVKDLDRDKLAGGGDMIVTPRDIDRSVRDACKLIGYAIDLALHDGLTIEDVDMFLS